MYQVEAHTERAGRRRTHQRAATPTAIAAWLLLAGSGAQGAELSGSADLFYDATSGEVVTRSTVEQAYHLDLDQELTPYLRFRLGFDASIFSVDEALVEDATRKSRQPRLGLLYARDDVTANLTYIQRTITGWGENADLEATSLLASIAWQPSHGPGYLVTFRDDSNAADAAVFGRDTESTFLRAETFYLGAWGAARYAYQTNQLSSGASSATTDQTRHEVRLEGSRSFFAKRLSTALSARVTRLDRHTAASSSSGLAQPVVARQGLSAVDPSPELGELADTPGLIDGDILEAAGSELEIGGANLYRNVGLDLGVTTPISRLEITVDTVTGPELGWEAYHSSDNLTWTRMSLIGVELDPVFLRYTLRFAETTDRYFKAVNTAVNPEPLVVVTELRALVDVPVGDERFASTLYRADAAVTYRPTQRLSARLDLGLSTDEAIAADLVRRDFAESHGGLALSADLTRTLRFDARYRLVDIEDNGQRPLVRTERLSDAILAWTPLATANVTLSVGERDELERSQLIQTRRTARLMAAAELLPDLRLVSDAQVFRIDDQVADIDRQGWALHQSVLTRPTINWTLNAGLGFTRYEVGLGPQVPDRLTVDVDTIWAATSFLNLNGGWSLGREDDRDTVNQSYGLTYSPGPKLVCAVSYFATSISEGRSTTSTNLNVDYYLASYLILRATLSRSSATDDPTQTGDITTIRVGLNAFF